MRPILSTLLFAGLLTSTSAFAMCPMSVGHDMSHREHVAPTLSKEQAKNPAIKAYVNADHTMHKAMNIAYTGDADIDFVTGMIPHHQGAVDMANVVLQYGKNEELKALAHRIIVAQEAEIGFMTQWLSPRKSAWRADDADSNEAVIAFKASMATMHQDMNINYTGDADVDFARGMIPHHQGAITMATILKKHGRDMQLRKLADDIIRSQAQEIALMQEWLAAHPAPEPVSKTKKTKKKYDHTHH